MNLRSNFLEPKLSQNFSIGVSAYCLPEHTMRFSVPNLLMNLAAVLIFSNVISKSSMYSPSGLALVMNDFMNLVLT